MVAAKWEDPSSSLELWAALAELAWKGKDKQNVRLHTYKRTACVCVMVSNVPITPAV